MVRGFIFSSLPLGNERKIWIYLSSKWVERVELLHETAHPQSYYVVNKGPWRQVEEKEVKNI